MNDNFMELKERRVWLCWNYREMGGKKTKVPIAASGERPAQTKRTARLG